MRVDEHRILASRPANVPGARWEARVGARNRLQVVLVVAPSRDETIVEMLSGVELEQLLAGAPRQDPEAWRCATCGAENSASRRWCTQCSGHEHAGDR